MTALVQLEKLEPRDPSSLAEMAAFLAGLRAAPQDVELAPLAALVRDRLIGAGDLDLGETGECITVLARLLAAKSAYLIAMPSDSASEGDEVASEGRRELPGEVREAGMVLSNRQGLESFAGRSLLESVEKPVVPRSPLLLVRVFEGIRRASEAAAVPLPVPEFVRLETALSNLVRQVKTRSRASVRRLLRGRNRNDAVVHFLALLELIRRGKVAVHQPSVFDDISVRWSDDSQERRDRAG